MLIFSNDIRAQSIDPFLENRVQGITSENLKVFLFFIPVFWCVLIQSFNSYQYVLACFYFSGGALTFKDSTLNCLTR